MAAQLRPYEPFEWAIFDDQLHAAAAIGSSVLWDQRASLAGTVGTLSEIGTLRATFRTGRVAIEAGGTIVRWLNEHTTFAPVTGGAEERPLGRRSDAGDYRVSTAILLSDADRPFVFLLRFGSRLPTTDNVVGLERDAIDFFSTLGGRYASSRLHLFAELGLGIHGTRLDHFEQSDVLVYTLGASAPGSWLRPSVLILGHTDAMDRTIRGNENLSEVRLRLRTGNPRWIQIEVIKGLVEFSPGLGLSVAIGTNR